ncbi:MAG: phosphoribosylformylglycinamidine synthase subunit PurL, partial [Proteobacteria bacterium]|nr:phosphoribosylformylglycinamidine synthase subunit PurL [Pseudomonadota bacterium]
FTEKLLIEACLELMDLDAIVAIQDMGAAGLTCSSFEMASKGGVGVELDLDRVPTREAGMSAYEIMLSESQERMLMVLVPEKEDEAREIFTKWELDFAVVGQITDSGRMVVKQGGEVVADLPIAPLADAAPIYERPWDPAPEPPVIVRSDDSEPKSMTAALKTLLASPDLCSKKWIWEQYDHMVMGDTVQRPGGDAAVVRVHGTDKGLAMTIDCTPRYCAANPFAGAAQAVAEAWRNLTAAGAKPLAITDAMNFGNPERPAIMGQFVQCIEGMREACLALDFPVVSGNVSFYNETNGRGISPTPAIGAVGLIADIAKTMTPGFKGEGEAIILIGETAGHLGCSLYLRHIEGIEDGAPPTVDLAAERRNGDFVRSLIEKGVIGACHDVSDGGLLVSVAEMSLDSGIGAAIENPAPTPGKSAPTLDSWLFGEDQGRYIITAPSAEMVLAAASEAGVPASRIGTTGGEALTLNGVGTISLGELGEAREGWLPAYMAGP